MFRGSIRQVDVLSARGLKGGHGDYSSGDARARNGLSTSSY